MKRRMTASVRFSRTLLVRSRPWPRRSSGTSAMPSRPVSAWRGLAMRAGLAPELDAAGGAAGAEQRLEELALAVALQPADAEHLAFAEVEARRRAAGAPPAKSRTRERDAAGRGRDALGVEPVEAAADHRGDDLVVADRAAPRARATVAPLRKMVSRSATPRTSAMRWEMKIDEPALGGELAGEREQPLGLARRQGRGRLVEDQDARGLRERLGDLDHLPLGERQPAHLLLRPELREAVAREELQRVGGGAPRRSTVPSRVRGSWRNQTFCSTRQVGDQRQLLEDRGDAARLRRVRVRPAR